MGDNNLVDQYQKICLQFSDFTNKNCREIKKMIVYTEEYYGLIADQLPDIEDNISWTVEKTRILINCFDKDSEYNKQQKMYQVLVSLKSSIRSISDLLRDKNELFHILNSIISQEKDNSVTDFKKIITLTSGLRKILNRLKVLAINSSIYTYNNHNHDSGFKVISERIHLISLKMIKNYQNIEQHINSLKGWRVFFQQGVEEIIKLESDVKDYSLKLKELFQDFFTSGITVSLTELMEMINGAVSSVHELMIEIQNQDIIKQNMENINKILQETNQEISIDETKNKQMIERLNFIAEVINLSDKLMSGVRQQLAASRERIGLILDQIDGNLNKLDQQLSKIKNKLGSFTHISKKIYSLLPDIARKTKNVEAIYSKLINSQERFSRGIEGVNKEFKYIQQYIERLNNIRVLAAIELSSIENKNNFIDKIDEVIDSLNKRSRDDIKSYDSIQTRLKGDLNKFQEIAVYTNKEILIFNDELYNLQGDFKLVNDEINEKAVSLTGQLSKLQEVNKKLRKRADKFEFISKLSEAFLNNINSIAKDIVELKKSYQGKLTYDNSLNNKRLIKLFQEFTSYQERKTAADEYYEIDIDIGDNGGKLTLF